MKRFAIAVSLLLAAGVAAAAKVYRQVQPDGTVVFTDQRPPGKSEAIDLPTVQTFEAPPLPAPRPAEKVDVDAFAGYTTFDIVSPENDQTIRDNSGIVPIRLQVAPALRRDHQVEVIMDGQVIGSGRSLSLTLQSVDRGAHAVQAKIRDKDGKEITRTAAITFYLQRVGRLSP